MTHRIDPAVLDEARRKLSLTSDEQLGAAIGKTGATVRNLRHGRSAPSLSTLLELKRLTGRPLDSLLLEASSSAA